jgi:hypothetical protein
MTSSEPPVSTTDPTTVNASPAPRPRSKARTGVALAAPLLVLAALLSSGGLPVLSGFAPASPDGSPSLATGTATDAPTATPGSSPDATAQTARPTLPTPSETPLPPPPRAEGDYLLLDRADLLARPMSGPAWDALLEVADGSTGRPRLRDQDERHGLTTLAVALVYARTGDEAYRDKARRQIMRVIGTEREGAHNAVLALGRQLGSYVLAADFIRLDGADDEEFRDWLSEIRTKQLGGHGRWTSLTGTHEDSANNWGAFAGASRIAASLYLGDTADVAAAAQVTRGFLGDAVAWPSFQPVEDSASWACDPDRYVPINPPCERGGIDLDGAIVRDISRGGERDWPPGESGISYTLESLQGLILQAELLTVNGYGDAWSWSDRALRRAADVVTRSGDAGGETWNRSEVSHHVPWLLNARYGLDLPTAPAGQGRVFGYTDWLYGE